MNKIELMQNLPRWVHASIKKYFKANLSGVELRCEGEEERNPEAPFFAELRIDGPTVYTAGTLGEYQGLVEVNILLTVQRNMKYVHEFQDKIGLCLAVMENCIPVLRIGSPNNPPDTGTSVGFLQRDNDNPIELNNFGQIDKAVQTQQGSVEAHYKIKLEI